MTTSRGMSLIELSVSLAILGVVVTGMMKFMQMSKNSVQSQRTQEELTSLKEELGTYFKNGGYCDSYFASQTFDPASPNPAMGSLSISHPNDASKTIAAAGLKLPGGSEITSVSLSDLVSISANRFSGKLHLVAQAPSGLRVSRFTPLLFNTSDTGAGQKRIDSCVVSSNTLMTMSCPSGEAITGINFDSQQVVCTSVGGGGNPDPPSPPAEICTVRTGMGNACCVAGETLRSGWCSSGMAGGSRGGQCKGCDSGDHPGRAHANCCRPAS